MSLATKALVLEDSRNEMRRQHNDHVKKIRTEKKAAEKHIIVEQDGAFYRYYGEMRSIRCIIEAAEERYANHINMLNLLRLFFEE